MSPVDVETVNERLNGLVNLLKAVGVDESGNAKRKNNHSSYNKNSAVPDARQLDDQQIAAIIQKLQMAQSEAPQIIAALEAQAKMKQRQRQRQPQVEEEEEEEEEVQEEEEEEDDEDDSYDDDDDGNYPMVGPGCSDDVSVVSDLTTPTVVQNPHVNEEEHYRDNHALPPMLIIGGGGGGGNHHQQQLPPMLIAPTKRKNLVGSVRANTLAATPLRNANGIKAPSSSKGNGGISSGAPSTPSSSNGKGAAAQRRKVYNATMERLTQDNGGVVLPSPPPTGTSPISYPQSPNSQPQLASSRKLKPSSLSNHQHISPTQQQQQQQQQQQLNNASNKDGTRKKVTRRASLAGGNVPTSASSSNRNVNDWDVPPGWDAFQPSKSASTLSKSRPAVTKKSSAAEASLVDDDGFLISPTVDFDPFAAAVTMRNNTNNNNSSRSRKNTDSKSVSSGSRRSNGSDPKPETNVQRRVKKPSTSAPPNSGSKMYKPSSSSPSSKNPHFVEQPTSSMPQYRPRPQHQQSMTNDPYHHHQPQQQPSPSQSQQVSKSRRPQRRASLGVWNKNTIVVKGKRGE